MDLLTFWRVDIATGCGNHNWCQENLLAFLRWSAVIHHEACLQYWRVQVVCRLGCAKRPYTSHIICNTQHARTHTIEDKDEDEVNSSTFLQTDKLCLEMKRATRVRATNAANTHQSRSIASCKISTHILFLHKRLGKPGHFQIVSGNLAHFRRVLLARVVLSDVPTTLRGFLPALELVNHTRSASALRFHRETLREPTLIFFFYPVLCLIAWFFFSF